MKRFKQRSPERETISSMMYGIGQKKIKKMLKRNDARAGMLLPQAVVVELTDDVDVNHPKHYTSHPSGIECIEVTEHFGFNLGNVIKYLWRAEEKGAPIKDLKKAAWYLNREIEKRERGTWAGVKLTAPPDKVVNCRCSIQKRKPK